MYKYVSIISFILVENVHLSVKLWMASPTCKMSSPFDHHS